MAQSEPRIWPVNDFLRIVNIMQNSLDCCLTIPLSTRLHDRSRATARWKVKEGTHIRIDPEIAEAFRQIHHATAAIRVIAAKRSLSVTPTQSYPS